MEWTEIVELAVKKAVVNAGNGKVTVDVQVDDEGVAVDVKLGRNMLHEFLDYKPYYSIIFDHNFAKAFWGEEDWDGELQEMVLKKDPLTYIASFL